jgi:hypothetical protein
VPDGIDVYYIEDLSILPVRIQGIEIRRVAIIFEDNRKLFRGRFRADGDAAPNSYAAL